MRRKVLILATVASMIEQFNMNNIDILQNLNYEVHIACNFYNGSNLSDERTKSFIKELESRNVVYYQIDFARNPFNVISNLKAMKQLIKIFKDNKYEFMHCHAPVASFIGRILAKYFVAKSIYTAHGFHFYKGAPLQNWLLYYPVEWLLSYFTDVLITINTEDYELAKHHMHAKKLEYLPGVGIDVEKFADTEIDKKAKRRELGIPEGCKLLLSVGELNKNKNHQVIIKAISELNDPSIHYAICGKGELYNYLIKLAKSLNIENQIHLLGSRSDIPEILKCADLFVHPSMREGLPVAVMEAISSGLMCMTSNVRGCKELMQDIFDGKNLVAINNTHTWMKALKECMNQNFICAEIGLKKIKKYDIKNVNEQLITIYGDL